MAAAKFPTAGLQLLLLIQATHSFVLLTANIEDVKKLAMKFVSESLADQIAGFIAQAAHQVINTASEEVHKDVSEENKNYNIKQVSSEREYAHAKGNTKHKLDIKQSDYRKDDIFSNLEENTKYTGEKKPLIQYTYPLAQDAQQFKSNLNKKVNTYSLKSRDDDVGIFRNNDVLTEDAEKQDDKINIEMTGDSGSLEDNALNDGGIPIEHNKPVLSFRAEIDPKKEIGHVQLVATSGDLVLTRVTTDKTSDEKSETENENKEVVKEETKGETWF